MPLKQFTFEEKQGNPIVFFLHVPKTGGTTLSDIMEKQYHPNSIDSIDRNPVLPDDTGTYIEDFKKFTAYRQKQINLVQGHFDFGLHESVKLPYTYITILRDPIDRVISWYYYILEDPDCYNYRQYAAHSDGFEDFIEKGYGGLNFLTKTLLTAKQNKEAGDDWERLDIAKNNLREYFTVIGLTEKFDESVVLLKLELGWDHLPLYSRQKVTKQRPKKEELPASTVELLIERNWSDILLYQYAESLYNDKVREAGDDFAKERERYRTLKDKLKSAKDFTAKRNLPQAFNAIQGAFAIEPESSDLYRELGLILLKFGEAEKGRLALLKAVQLNPNDLDAITHIASLDRRGVLNTE